MPEWVKNVSDKPIPEPYSFTPDEKRILHDFQRRKHLETWDDRYKRMPLSDEERSILELMEGIIFQGTLVMFRGIELRFAPGQLYQVPDFTSHAIAATNPEKLRALKWEDVRHINTDISTIRFETPAENLQLIIQAAGLGGHEKGLHHGPVTISMEDGLMQFGDGPMRPIPKA